MAAVVGFLAGAIPLALDGESAAEAGGSGTAIAVVSVVSMAAGYLLLFLLWRYVFSSKAHARRNKNRSG
jgi:hypothetical protein